ncbi:MAG: hypothetical protein JST80_05410 [Bdellovibrionales bacterium]|nr:hypothetical protein [Bdellovibrionales bacterium]
MKPSLHTLLTVIAAATVILGSSARADRWDSSNNPTNFEDNYEYRLSALPLTGMIPEKTRPWSDSYWPRNKGSINYRWNSPQPTGYYNVIPSSRAAIASMNATDLAALSPAEKFDLVQGHYDFPLTTSIAGSITPRAKDFEGVCDGWTASAIQFPEPKPVTIKNPDGIEIPFGSSDVKALMSYYGSLYAELKPVFVGSYCIGGLGMRLGTGRCADINPGAYHVILANEIGLRGKSFASDIEIGKETWNQPIYGFEFQIVGSGYTKNGGKSYQVKAKMMYAEDDPDPGIKPTNWDPVVGTSNYRSEVQEVEYLLETDANDNITGGSWITKYKHPDLFWKPTAKIEFKDGFQAIQKIYDASQVVQ